MKVGGRMPERRICYRTREENAVAQLAHSHGSIAWSEGIDSQTWSIRVAELEEKIVVARRYVINMLEIVEEAEGYAEKM